MKDAPKPSRSSNRASLDNGIDWNALGGYDESANVNHWKDIDAGKLATVVEFVTALGYGITLGRTSDGGALSLAVLISGEPPRKFYFTSAEQFGTFAERLAVALT